MLRHWWLVLGVRFFLPRITSHHVCAERRRLSLHVLFLITLKVRLQAVQVYRDQATSIFLFTCHFFSGDSAV